MFADFRQSGWKVFKIRRWLCNGTYFDHLIAFDLTNHLHRIRPSHSAAMTGSAVLCGYWLSSVSSCLKMRKPRA